MQSSSKEIRLIMCITAGIWCISLLVFLLIGFKAGVSLVLTALYGVWNLVIFAGAYWRISRNINQVLGKVDNCIQSMIDGTPVKEFSATEESLLGKFQTQIEKLYYILNSAKDRERKAHEEISELVADLVHQVNTPLTNIQMYCSFLTQDTLSDKEKTQICRVIDSQVEKLGWFAEGFTKTVRLESDIRKLEPKKQPILNMVLSAVDQISLKAKMQGNEICLSGAQDIEAVYDRRWTEEALFNILDNAVKYGEKNMPFQIHMEAYDLFARIDVTNYGTVIPKEDYTKIFQRFYRGKNAALIKDGVGLGLYLAREIITGQGGYLKVESKKETGNIFSLFLRMEK